MWILALIFLLLVPTLCGGFYTGLRNSGLLGMLMARGSLTLIALLGVIMLWRTLNGDWDHHKHGSLMASVATIIVVVVLMVMMHLANPSFLSGF